MALTFVDRLRSRLLPPPPPPAGASRASSTDERSSSFDPAEHAKAVRLDDAGTLFLSAAGRFVAAADQARPGSVLEEGDLLFQAAQASEGRNLFATAGVSFEAKQPALDALLLAYANADVARVPANGLTSEQALQVRSCVAPLLLDLGLSLSAQVPHEAGLQERVFSEYLAMAQRETHGLCRESMAADLRRAYDKLTPAVRQAADELIRSTATLSPPYGEWFAHGNDTLRLEYFVGQGFWNEELAAYAAAGFLRQDQPDGTVLLTRDEVQPVRGEDGTLAQVRTRFELRLHDGRSGMFSSMDDPKVHGVVYSGHANYGNAVPAELPGAPAQVGAKVFFALQCGGKGIHHELLEAFPRLQVVASRLSSYGQEDRATLLNVLFGVASRQTWSEMAEANRRGNSDNYYFPSDVWDMDRVLDRDRDGKADLLDRVVNHNAFKPNGRPSVELAPKDPGVSADRLDGEVLHEAMLRITRLTGYNVWTREWENEGVLNDGYWDGTAGDPLFKLEEEEDPSGGKLLRLQVNKFYAHVGEDALGAALGYELGQLAATGDGVSPADARAVGVLLAAKCLDVDGVRTDDAAWASLLQYARLPRISLADAKASVHLDEHDTAGSPESLADFKAKLAAAGLSLA